MMPEQTEMAAGLHGEVEDRYLGFLQAVLPYSERAAPWYEDPGLSPPWSMIPEQAERATRLRGVGEDQYPGFLQEDSLLLYLLEALLLYVHRTAHQRMVGVTLAKTLTSPEATKRR